MSPCIALIFSLKYANMAALFSKKARQSGPTNYSREETSQRTLIVVLIKANLPPRSSSAAR
jgi:hypothetical protein